MASKKGDKGTKDKRDSGSDEEEAKATEGTKLEDHPVILQKTRRLT